MLIDIVNNSHSQLIQLMLFTSPERFAEHICGQTTANSKLVKKIIDVTSFVIVT